MIILFRTCSWPTDCWNIFHEYFAFKKYRAHHSNGKIVRCEDVIHHNRYRFIGLFLVPRVVPGTFLRVEQHQVHLGTEEEGEGHRGADRDAHHQAGDLDLSRGS